MSAKHYLLGTAVAATLGVAAVLHFCPCRGNDARDRATETTAPAAPSTTAALPVPSPFPSVAGAPALPVGGAQAPGPQGPVLTIDQAPEDPPPPGVDVTYAPSPNPPPLAPAGSESAIYEPWKSPEEKKAYEERERLAWEERKSRELELVLEFLTQELSLTAMQAQRLRGILEDESRRRIAIVTDLTEKRISQAEFEDRVDASLQKGRAELASLFSPDQMSKYQTLKPRRQVLNDKTITGH